MCVYKFLNWTALPFPKIYDYHFHHFLTVLQYHAVKWNGIQWGFVRASSHVLIKNRVEPSWVKLTFIGFPLLKKQKVSENHHINGMKEYVKNIYI